MFEKIKKWFGKEQKPKKRIAWNDTFELLNEKGTFDLKDFTGHISFGERTECDVEHADITFVIGNPRYIEGDAYHAPWSRGVNYIVWHNGIVVKGNLCSRGFENGEFRGDKLLIVKDAMKGVFKGVELHEYLPM